MTLPEAQARLAAVREAINRAIANGGMTSYSIGGRSKSVNLDFLMRIEKETEQLVSRLSSGMFHAARFRDPE